MALKIYRQLDVWKIAMKLAEDVYRLSGEFPNDERFGLTSQIRRCAVSVPSNIAEGAGRSGRKEFLRHLSIARGSLMELETQLALSVRLGLVERKKVLALWDEAQRVGQMLNRLMAKLRKPSQKRTTDHG